MLIPQGIKRGGMRFCPYQIRVLILGQPPYYLILKLKKYFYDELIYY